MAAAVASIACARLGRCAAKTRSPTLCRLPRTVAHLPFSPPLSTSSLPTIRGAHFSAPPSPSLAILPFSAMSRCHLSHLLPWDNLVHCYDLPAQMREHRISRPVDPRPNDQRDTLPLPPKYVTQLAAYHAFTLPARKRSRHFLRRFSRAVTEFANSEMGKYSDEEVMAVREVLTEQDRHDFPDLFSYATVFDEHCEIASWRELTTSSEVEPAPSEEEDDEPAEGEEGEERDQDDDAAADEPPTPRIHRVPAYQLALFQPYQSLWGTVDVLKFLILQQRTLPLLALLRRCPEQLSPHRGMVMRNRICNQWCLNYFVSGLLGLYLHVNLAIAWGETGGGGRKRTSKPKWEETLGDAAYHAELHWWLRDNTPDQNDGGHDAAFNALLQPFLTLYTVTVSGRGKYPDVEVPKWTLRVDRCEELCRRLFAVFVTWEMWQRLLNKFDREKEGRASAAEEGCNWEAELDNAMINGELGVAVCDRWYGEGDEV